MARLKAGSSYLFYKHQRGVLLSSSQEQDWQAEGSPGETFRI